MTVAYHIAAHRNGSQLRLLVDLLCAGAGGDVLVLIHVDRSAPPEVHQAAAQAAAEHEGVHLQKSREVRWGGYSIVAVTLAGIKELLGLGEWSHVVNLSGLDLPLIPTARLAALLAAHEEESWIQTFDPHVWEHPRRRIDPVWRETGASEEVHRSRFTIRREWLLGRRTWRGQSGWMVLARPHCALLTDPWRTWSIRLFFRWTLIPDESFFATAFTGWHATVHDDDKRFIRWTEGSPHPDLLSPADLRMALQSADWFARKFDLDAVGESEVREILSGQHDVP